MRRSERAVFAQLVVNTPAHMTDDTLSVLIVEPALEELLQITSRLTSAGFRVTAAESFAQAKPLLDSQPPSILVTAVRLEAYNGLHLVLRAKAVRPSIAAVVTSATEDPVLRADAEAMGATFIVTPVDEKDLVAAIFQTLFRRDETAPIRPPYERRVRDRRATVELFDEDDRRSAERRRERPWNAADAFGSAADLS
jgi:DNA-binding NtrC family response regulator